MFLSPHQNNLIQSVENNLTIILVQEWRFFVKSEQSYEFLRFPTKWGFLNSISEVSAWFLNKKEHAKITWKLDIFRHIFASHSKLLHQLD